MDKKKRLSVQICRVLAIVECLRHRSSTCEQVAEYVNQAIPHPVSTRTLRRDLDVLIAMGYCQHEKLIGDRVRQFSITQPNSTFRKAI